MFDTKHFELPDGRRLAFRHIRGNGPALVFLPGYMSDMAGGKATALFDWARKQGRTCLLLDYSGCGESEAVPEAAFMARSSNTLATPIPKPSGTRGFNPNHPPSRRRKNGADTPRRSTAQMP